MNKGLVYFFLTVACLFFVLAMWLRIMHKWPGSEMELSQSEQKSRVNICMVLSGIFIIISGLYALGGKKVKNTDIMQMGSLILMVIVSWMMVWHNASELSILLLLIAMILNCAVIDSSN